MKKILALLVLTVSVGAIAQVEMNSDEVEVRGDQSIIVRTSKTPDKVKLTLNNIPVQSSVCNEVAYRQYNSICTNTVPVREERVTCRDIVETRPTPSTPRGPRYNGTSAPTTTTTTRRVCTKTYATVYRQVSTPCIRTESYCAKPGISTSYTSDSVKIKFKDLPALGGSEQETFSITAEQKDVDNSNIIYRITPINTINNKAYEVVKKGILGFDSYVIQSK